MADGPILVFGEGPHDIGRAGSDEARGERWARWAEPLDEWPSGQDDEPDYDGAVAELVMNQLEEAHGRPRAATRRRLFARSLREITTHGRKGLAGKVLGAMAAATAAGASELYLVVDQDGLSGRRAEMQDGRTEGRQKGLALPTALGTAVEALEAWLLGDRERAAEILEIDREAIPSDPEALSGRRGSGDHPKDRLQRLIALSPRVVKPGALYRELAAGARLAMLRERCPRGFGRFAEDIDEQLGQYGPR